MAEDGAISSRYPKDIFEQENRYISILVKEQDALSGGIDALLNQVGKTANNIAQLWGGGMTVTQKSKKLVNAKTVYGIALPLPNQLSEDQQHSWEKKDGTANKVGGAIGDKVKEMMGKYAFDVGAVMSEAASATGMRKPMIDPGYFQDYTGTDPRGFNFTWDLVPNNQEEADNIMEIILRLKKYTLPTTTVSGMSLLSPYIFDIQTGNDKINEMINMNNVVCESMAVNYSVDGTLQMFPDGTPKHMQLTLGFKERSVVTAEFYNN